MIPRSKVATKFKRGANWYIKTKDPATGSWTQVACGPQATAVDAETIRKNYDAIELNSKHHSAIRDVVRPMTEAIVDFRDNILLRSDIGRTKAANTLRRERVVISNFITYLTENKIRQEYDVISDDVIQKYFDVLSNGSADCKKKSAKTRREERRILYKFFEWSIERNYTKHNPVTRIINPKRDAKRPRFFTEEELMYIFSKANQPFLNIFKFLYLTGLRVGELSNLVRSDYIEAKQLILLRVMDGNKTKREETVPLNKSAIEILKHQVEINAGFSTDESKIYWFVNSSGAKLDNENIYRALKRITDGKERKITSASPHTFRHTCASHLVIKGVSLYVVKEILRHSSIKETEVYSHLSKEVVRDAIEQLSVVDSSKEGELLPLK